MQDQPPGEQDPQVMARLVADAKAELDRSRRMQSEVSALLHKLADKGPAADEPYQRALAGFQELGTSITEATRALRDHEQAQQARAGANVAGDFVGLERVTRPMGPPGGPAGIVTEGAAVINLQRFLARAGFSLAESGRYDDQTGRAVQQFQRRLNLPADGKVGAATRKAINDLLPPG